MKVFILIYLMQFLPGLTLVFVPKHWQLPGMGASQFLCNTHAPGIATQTKPSDLGYKTLLARLIVGLVRIASGL